MGIDKFRAIVGVNAQEFKGQGLSDGFHGATYSFLSFAQHRTGLDPGRVNVGEVQRMAAVSRSAAARMRDQIDFGETRLPNVPAIGLDGNVMLQQGARFGPTVDPFFELVLLGAEPVVDGAGTETEQLLFQPGCQVKSFASPGHPHRQQRLQTD